MTQKKNESIDHVIDVMIEDIVNASDKDLLTEVLNDYGDPGVFVAEFDKIAAPSLKHCRDEANVAPAISIASGNSLGGVRNETVTCVVFGRLRRYIDGWRQTLVLRREATLLIERPPRLSFGIVVVALVAAAALIAVGITARVTDSDATATARFQNEGPVLKAGKPPTFTTRDGTSIR